MIARDVALARICMSVIVTIKSSAHKRSMASASPRRYASFQTFSSCSISFMSSGFADFERKGQNNPKTIPDAQIKLLIRRVNFFIRHSLLRLIIVSINIIERHDHARRDRTADLGVMKTISAAA